MKNIFLTCFIFISSSVIAQCDSISAINSQIIELAGKKLGKKVDRGECWDLAKYALESCNATWDNKFEFGRQLGKEECIMAGDVIQFKGVKIKYKEGKKNQKQKN